MNIFKPLLIISILTSLAIPACAVNNSLYFQFRDNAKNHYSSSSLSNDFQKAYGINYQPGLVLIQTDKKDDYRFKAQSDILTNIDDIEERGLIFIDYCSDGNCHEGYYISPDERPKFFVERGFHVYLISPEGQLLKDSSEPFSAEQIKSVFPKRTSIK